MSTNHVLKIWPENFRRVQESEMHFQIRNNDRNFQDRDTVSLQEWVPPAVDPAAPEQVIEGRYTGLSLDRRVNRVFTDLPGLQPGYCVFTMIPMVRGS